MTYYPPSYSYKERELERANLPDLGGWKGGIHLVNYYQKSKYKYNIYFTILKNIICLSYKYFLVVILARICHGQVGRSLKVSATGQTKPFSPNRKVNSLRCASGELVNNQPLSAALTKCHFC